MKTTITEHLKELFTNRHLTVLSIVMLLLASAFIIYLAVVVRPSDLQLVTHYTAFGLTHLYRDQWFYLTSFGAFALITAFFHIAGSIKLYVTKGSPLAIAFAWAGVGVILLAWVVAASIINVWSPV